jgi:hypothetical protein
VRYRLEGEFANMLHCHCSMCRKFHGSAFATYVGAPAEGFEWISGEAEIARYESSPGAVRTFCQRCGSPVPSPDLKGPMAFVPAGTLESDCGARPEAHIYVDSSAPWYTIPDAVPQHATTPPEWPDPGITRAVVEPETEGAIGGSCLCGSVRFEITGTPTRFANCHCSRCRHSRGAAHASNVFAALDDFRWLAGEHQVTVYDLPGAERFGANFCRTCGSKMPRANSATGTVNVPAGCLDTDPGLTPEFHIFVADKAPWFEIRDSLPQTGAGR